MKTKVTLSGLLVAVMLIGSCAKEETNTFGRIYGYVTDSNTGEPVRAASVTLSPDGQTAVTGNDGRYDYGDLTAGEYNVQVMKTGYQTNTKRVNVEPGYITSADMQLSPETEKYGTIRGLIKDAETGEPIPVASVSITPGTQTTTTGSDGYYNYSNLTPGTYTVQVMKTGYQTNTKTIDVAANSVATGDMLLYYGSGNLKVDRQMIEFGMNNNISVFGINNTGQQDLNWEIDSKCEWIGEISPRSGTLKANGTVSVTVKVDRSKIPDSKKYSNTIIIASNGGSSEIVISINGTETPGGANVVTAGLLAYYTFDDGTATDLTDNHINANLMKEPDFIDDTPNRSGKALYLNATKGQYLVISNNPVQNILEHSFSFWTKELGGAGQIMSGVSPYKNSPYLSYPYLSMSAGAIALRYNSNTSAYVNFSYDANAILDGAWHLLTYTIGGGKVALYVDSKKVAEAAGTYVKSGCPEIFFGGNSGISSRVSMSMKLDNIRMYSRVLTQDDVNKIYAAEKE